MKKSNNTIWINKFDSVRSTLAFPMEASWDVLTEYFATGHQVFPNKEDAPLFNLVKYKTQSGKTRISGDNSHIHRIQANIEQVEALVIDYDGKISIENAKKRFKDYEYIGYTSFSHLQELRIEKFRLIFKLTNPISAWINQNKLNSISTVGDYFYILNDLMDFAGPCDPVIKNPNQVYFIPTSHPDRRAHAQCWHNSGSSFDWTILKRTAPSLISGQIQVSTKKERSKNDGLHLAPDQQIKTSNGLIRVGDVKSRISNVLCPFHNDKNGTEFINRSPAGNVYLYCRHCDQTYYMIEDNLDGTDKTLQLRERYIKSKTNEKNDNPVIDDGFEYDPVSKFKPADRKRVAKQLATIQKVILKDRGFTPEGGVKTYKSHILYMPEGAGKSLLAIDFLRAGYNVVFACLSWEQVAEKYKDFEFLLKPGEADLKINWSLDGLIQRRFGLKPIRKSASSYFTPGDLLKEETVKYICEQYPKYSDKFVRLSLEFCDSRIRFEDLIYEQLTFDEIDFKSIADDKEIDEYLTETIQNTKKQKTKKQKPRIQKPRMLLTTFAQLRILKVLNDYIPKDWIIWFDDPGIADVLNISPLKRAEEKTESLVQQIFKNPMANKLTIKGTIYELRDYEKELGYAVRNHRCIYTTTESATMLALKHMLIARSERFAIHDKMESLADGEITILGTDKVWMCYDALIPLMARRLEKQEYNVILIADGVASRYNHSNSKGQNKLNKNNLLVEISAPHQTKVRTFTDALKVSMGEQARRIAVELMHDQLHQAIGRNSGYRWAGQECVILVDKNKHHEIIEKCRYKYDKVNSVIIDRTQNMTSKDIRLSDSASNYVKAIEAFLNNVDQYLCNKKFIRHDLNYVVKSIKSDAARFSYIARLLVALTTLSTWRFDQGVDNKQHVNSFTKQCRILGEWILKTHVPAQSRNQVLSSYLKIIMMMND